MKVKEFYKNIDSLPEPERIEGINHLLPLLSPISIKALRRFKKGTEGGSPKQFVEARNKEIKGCIEWELSYIGVSTRAILKLPDFDWDTELAADAKMVAAAQVRNALSGKRSDGSNISFAIKTVQTTKPLIKRMLKIWSV